MARTSNPDRLKGLKTLGVDEHIWRPSRLGSIGPLPSSSICLVTRPDACTPGCSTLSLAAREVSIRPG
jgi:hypothetical protein